MKTYQWIWQNPDWPKFSYNIELLLPRLTSLHHLIGALEITSRALAEDELLDARERVLTDDVLETSAIEGEILLRSSVRASIRKRLGLPNIQDGSTRHTDALVSMLLDARNCADSPLPKQKLFAWHAALFSTGYSGLHKIRVGKYRGNEEMQVVSVAVGKEKVHYIAPPRSRIETDMRLLLTYINKKDEQDSLIQAGVAHLWFIMIHPFDDGNGRIARAITDYILSAKYCHMMKIVSLSKQISMDKKGYYRTLEQAGKGDLDITAWLSWFLDTLAKALHESKWTIDRIMKKVHFWQKHKH